MLFPVFCHDHDFERDAPEMKNRKANTFLLAMGKDSTASFKWVIYVLYTHFDAEWYVFLIIPLIHN